jgi:hypothetical protein
VDEKINDEAKKIADTVDEMRETMDQENNDRIKGLIKSHMEVPGVIGKGKIYEDLPAFLKATHQGREDDMDETKVLVSQCTKECKAYTDEEVENLEKVALNKIETTIKTTNRKLSSVEAKQEKEIMFVQELDKRMIAAEDSLAATSVTMGKENDHVFKKFEFFRVETESLKAITDELKQNSESAKAALETQNEKMINNMADVLDKQKEG